MNQLKKQLQEYKNVKTEFEEYLKGLDEGKREVDYEIEIKYADIGYDLVEELGKEIYELSGGQLTRDELLSIYITKSHIVAGRIERLIEEL